MAKRDFVWKTLNNTLDEILAMLQARIHWKTGQPYTYANVVTAAKSVRGALTKRWRLGLETDEYYEAQLVRWDAIVDKAEKA